MKKEVIYNADLHFEHEHWNRELDFWQDELRSFHKRIEELVMRWTDPSVLSQIEKFQNQFMIQEGAIDSIKNQIQMHETNIAEHYKHGEDVLNKNMVSKHLELRDRLEIQRKMYENLKKDFFRFMSKYM
jgi:hypothetical protein